jgi:hypothetical protein
MLTTIITSAAVGALVSAAVTLIGAALERRARRKELLLTKAIDLATDRTRTYIELAEKSGRPVGLIDNIFLAEDYYQELSLLLEKGKLSEGMRAKKPYQSPSEGGGK